MCIGIPAQVLLNFGGRALVSGRGREFEVDTVLVGDCTPGDWLLIFLDSARERLTAERAAEVNAALDLVERALARGRPTAQPDQDHTQDAPSFELPSAMSAHQLRALTGAP